MRVPVIAGVVGMLLVTTVATPAAADQQSYFWRWSDGADARARTLDGGRYRSQEQLPKLIVTAEPASPRRQVTLQYRDGARWRAEDTVRTDRSGRATLELNPYCEDGSWCDETLAYRLLVNGVDSSFTLTFTR
jgi:hypothetical protein